VIEINNYKYYVPLSSPKDNKDYVYIDGKRNIRKNSLIVIRIIEGEGEQRELKGTLQIGTMIPVPDSELIEYNVNEELDLNYRNLVWSELEFIRKHEKSIVRNATVLYKKKARCESDKVVMNCLDFMEIERLCDYWKQNRGTV
jgi:protein AbiQ